MVQSFVDLLGLSADGRSTLAIALWLAIWWITEAVPIAATGLLPLVLFPLTQVMSVGQACGALANKMVFLFLGGFIIAAAIEKTNLHKRIALTIISAIGTDWNKVLLGFIVASAFLSMWISNTATAVMMLPIGLAVIDTLGSVDAKRKGPSLMLAIAYGCSTGGIATIVGTPTNVIFTGVVEDLYGREIAFSDWMLVGMPFSLLMVLAAWLYLSRVAYPSKEGGIAGGKSYIRDQLSALGPMQYAERMALVVFVVVALAWMSRKYLLQGLLPGIDDTVIAIAGAVLLFVIPSGRKDGQGILEWAAAERIPWGILLLFGGGLALAEGFKVSGLASWIGGGFTDLAGMPLIVILLVIIVAVNLLTEITSNVATAAMLMPILAALALAIDVHPYLLMIAATIAASCAFMLPIATPPNAVVFGSGYLDVSQMMRVGIWMNILSIGLAVLLVYYLLPLIWGIDVAVFPTELRGR